MMAVSHIVGRHVANGLFAPLARTRFGFGFRLTDF
jgi:hypothetical protein